MYRGLFTHKIGLRPSKAATGQAPYRLKNKVHSVVMRGMSGDDGPDYMGPPRPGQSWSQYESFMSMPIVAGIGAATVGLLIGGPLGALAGGGIGWLAGGGTKRKSQTQGG